MIACILTRPKSNKINNIFFMALCTPNAGPPRVLLVTVRLTGVTNQSNDLHNSLDLVRFFWRGEREVGHERKQEDIKETDASRME